MSSANYKSIERDAFIFNIQKYNMHDGPGLRTIVFFKGCPLRCKWCANPESLKGYYEILFKKSSCVNCGKCVEVCPVNKHKMENGVHIVDRNVKCVNCGNCVKSCIKSALEIAGETKTVSEIVDIIKEDEMFYQTSGGGVTLGGGECTMQPEAALSILTACKAYGINTAIETCGYCKTDKFLEIAEKVDYFLYDIKHMNPAKHNELTGVSNDLILHNLSEILKRRKNVTVRMPMLKGINDSYEEISAIIEFLKPFKEYKNFQGIHLLPYHKMGVNKYNQLDLVYPIDGDPSLTDEELAKIEGWIKDSEISVKVLRH